MTGGDRDAASRPPAPEGEEFGPYRLVELLGRGGMGEVWRAFDTRRRRMVALKRLAGGWADVPAFQQRFRLEAEATASLDSEHVIVIHDYGEIDGRLFIDMRLVSGGDLAGLLTAQQGGLAPALAVDLCRQIADGLDAAHRAQLVHRDVKPSNVMLAPDAGGRRAYLVDFGIAKLADELGSGGVTVTGATLGTPAYMAPELFIGAGAATVASDVYALGCVLFQMLTGRRPFPGTTTSALMYQHLNEPPPSPSSVRGDLAPFDRVLAHALAKNPAYRHPGAGILARDAAEVLAAQAATVWTPGHGLRNAPGPVSGPGSSWPPGAGPAVAAATPRPWWRRRWAVLVAAAAVVVIAAGTVVGVVATRSSTPPPAVGASTTPRVGPVVPGQVQQLAVSLQGPAGVRFSPDGRRGYVADNSSNTLAVLDTASGATVATVALPGALGPSLVALSPDGRRAYVTDNGASPQALGHSVFVVDTATNAVVATVPVGSGPLGVVLTPDGRRAYVSNYGSADTTDRTVSVIDTATNAVIATIPVGDGPSRPGISSDGTKVYVPNYGPRSASGSTVTVIDTATGAPTTIPAGDVSPTAVLVSPDGRRVYIVCSPAHPSSVQVLDTATRTLTPLDAETVNEPLSAALSPDGRTLVVPDNGPDATPGNTVSIIDTVTGGLRRTTVSGRPLEAAFTPDGRAVWVTSNSPPGLWRIPLNPA